MLESFKGLRVVEIGQAFAGPFAAEVLGFLGAEVIKIERPGVGDEARKWGPPFIRDSSAAFNAVNRNKFSVECDLKSEKGHAQLLSLLETTDILLHNSRPGNMDKLGLGYESLSKQFPKLIFAEISAFGNAGPMQHQPGYEILSQAYGGIMSITGEVDGLPSRSGPSVCDFGAGMWLVVGILSALLRRQQTGQGGLVQTSLFETSLVWASIAASGYLSNGIAPIRMGAGHPLIAPYGYFDTDSEPIIIACASDQMFRKLTCVLGCPDLADDDRFRDSPNRTENKELIEGIVTDILKTRPRDEWIDELNEAGIPCSPLNTVPQALKAQQTQALNMLVQHSDDATLRSIGFPLSFEGERPTMRHSAPQLGEHSSAILKM
jgi:formyl-CoA transferase